MTHRPGLRLLAALVPAVALLVPGVAHAERLATPDAVGDVVRTTFVEGSEDTYTAAPDETAFDVTRTVVTHHAARLRVTVRFRDLHPTRSHLTYVKVRTPDGRYEIFLDRGRGEDSVDFAGRPGMQDCDGLRWSASNTTDRVAVSLPTSCLGSPRWVQVGVGAAGPETVDGDSVDEDGAYLADEALRTGVVRSSVRVGSKVRPG